MLQAINSNCLLKKNYALWKVDFIMSAKALWNFLLHHLILQQKLSIFKKSIMNICYIHLSRLKISKLLLVANFYLTLSLYINIIVSLFIIYSISYLHVMLLLILHVAALGLLASFFFKLLSRSI